MKFQRCIFHPDLIADCLIIFLASIFFISVTNNVHAGASPKRLPETTQEDSAESGVIGPQDQDKLDEGISKHEYISQKNASDCDNDNGSYNCRFPALNYRPEFPKLGNYSVEHVCQSIHEEKSASKVVLQHGENLANAYKRLVSFSNRHVGGILEIPWDVEIKQCDNLYITGKKVMPGGLTIRGLTGPKGEQPRLYCRKEARDGTIPESSRTGFAFKFGIGGPVLIENIHIDGYQRAIISDTTLFVARNNYIHHQMNNAIEFSNFKHDVESNIKQEFCGNEVSHSGSGNTRHGFYMHRHLSEKYSVEVVLVDNLIHSMDKSSAYKSIAEKNVLINNRIYGTLETDPSFTPRHSTILIDIASCAENVISGNRLKVNKPTATGYGDTMIGVRNRRTILRGCDMPRGWSADRIPEKISGSEFWSSRYWKSLEKRALFRTYIQNNQFEAEGAHASDYHAISMWGTYPNYEARSFGATCLLEAPDDWYERARVYVNGNVYYNFQKSAYKNEVITHSQDECGYAQPLDLPSRNVNMFEIGSGEKFVSGTNSSSMY